jgi:hypothetical protein
VRLAQTSFGGPGAPEADAFTQAATRVAQVHDPFADADVEDVRGLMERSPLTAAQQAAVDAGTAGPNTRRALERRAEFDDLLARPGDTMTEDDLIARRTDEGGIIPLGEIAQTRADLLDAVRRRQRQTNADPFALTPEEQAIIDQVDEPGNITFERGSEEARLFSDARRKQRMATQKPPEDAFAMAVFEQERKRKRAEELNRNVRVPVVRFG